MCVSIEKKIRLVFKCLKNTDLLGAVLFLSHPVIGILQVHIRWEKDVHFYLI